MKTLKQQATDICIDIFNDYTRTESIKYCSGSVQIAWKIGKYLSKKSLNKMEKIMAHAPISPNDVVRTKRDMIPDKVIEVINALIIREWDGSSAVVRQDDIVELVKIQLKVTSNYIFDKGWLDVEDIFKEAGWVVRYEQQCRDENFKTFFEFKKQEKK